MCHTTRHSYEDLPVGAEVSIHGIDFKCRVTKKEGGMLYVDFDWWYDHEFESRTEHEVVPYERYEYTYARSPDNIERDPSHDWAEVEQAYGINHLGSRDPDPARNLALRILKGEPVACRTATQILMSGQIHRSN